MSRRIVTALALTAAVAAGYCYARRRALHWGSTPNERDLQLPGDDIVPDADLVATRAITIRATPEEVWPWLAQLGQGRGGFYSYDAFENALGLDIHSADAILAEFQDLAVGDTIRLAEPVELTVAVADAGHALVLAGAPDPDSGGMGADAASPPMPYVFSWAFVLVPAPDGGCRLVVRERYGYLTPWAPLLVEPVEWASFVMSERMLRGIRDRAETHR